MTQEDHTNKLESEFNTAVPIEISEDVGSKGWGSRHQQCLLLFCCLTIAYSMRACMGVSLVAMTESRHNINFEEIVGNSSNFITSNNSVPLNLSVNNNIEENEKISGLLLFPPYPTFKWEKKIQDTIQSSFFWGYMILQIPGGQLVHYFGSRYLLTSALLINCVISLLLPWGAFYGGWVLVVICRIIQGLAQACIMPGIHTFLGKWAPLEERGRMSAFVFGGSALGAVVGLPITGFIASSFLGWPGIFRFYGCLAGIAGGFVWWLTADSPAEHKTISDAERRYIQDRLGQSKSKKSKRVPWGHILRSRGLYAIVAGHIGSTWGQITLYSEVPAYMDKVMGVNIKANGLLSALPFLTMWLTNFFFSWASDMLIVKKILNVSHTRKLANTIGSVTPAIGLVVLAYAPKNLYFVETTLVIICSSKIAAFVGFHINHIDLTPNYSGTLMSISNFVSNLCGSMALLVTGFILTDVSDVSLWRIVFFMAAGVYMTTNLIYVIFGTAEKADWDDINDEKTEMKNELETLKPMLKE